MARERMSVVPEKKVGLPEAIKEQMLEQARAELPFEACGIVSGSPEKGAVKFYPARNEVQSATRYSIDPEDLLRILEDIERKGLEVWGIFHSHPVNPAYPSERDLDFSFYPDAYYFIVSLQEPEQPDLRAFRIQDRLVEEFEVVVK